MEFLLCGFFLSCFQTFFEKWIKTSARLTQRISIRMHNASSCKAAAQPASTSTVLMSHVIDFPNAFCSVSRWFAAHSPSPASFCLFVTSVCNVHLCNTKVDIAACISPKILPFWIHLFKCQPVKLSHEMLKNTSIVNVWLCVCVTLYVEREIENSLRMHKKLRFASLRHMQ